MLVYVYLSLYTDLGSLCSELSKSFDYSTVD